MVKSGQFNRNLYQLYNELKENKYLDYYNLIEKYSEAFGKKNIHLINYNNLNDEKNIYTVFLDILKIRNFPHSKIPKKNQNESFSVISTQLLMLINERFGYDITEFFLNNPPEWFPVAGEKSQLSPEERMFIMSDLEHINNKVAVKYFNSPPPLFSTQDLNVSSNDWRMPLNDEIEVLFRKSLAHLSSIIKDK